MSKVKEFNINDFIKVKLTEHGRNMHIQNYKKYLGENYNKNFYVPKKDRQGLTKYQLWEFMNIFGEHMFNGAEQVIENNLIYFEEVHGRELVAKEPVRCKDCKHRPIMPDDHTDGFDLKFPDAKCPCQCDDGWYSWYPQDDWFCADGERQEDR